MDINLKLKKALESLMPCSEEPIRGVKKGASYMVWRKTGENTVIASGSVYGKSLSYEIEANLLFNEDAESIAREIKERLANAGFYYTAEYNRNFEAETNRRVVTVAAKIVEDGN